MGCQGGWDQSWGANPAAPYYSGGVLITPGFFACNPNWTCQQWRDHYAAWWAGFLEEWPAD